MNRRRISTQRAFTLSEILVSTAIFGLVISGVMAVFLSTNRSIHGVSVSIDQNQKAGILQNRLLLDMRAIIAISDIAETSFSATLQQYGEQTDLQHQPEGPAPVEVKYEFDADSKAVYRTQKASGDRVLLMSGVKNLRFEYFNRAGVAAQNQTTIAASINAVRVHLTPVSRSQFATGTDNNVLSALVQIRNRK